MLHYFILGKGGVGKSTVALLKALAFNAQGKTVRLVSLDQAHNLSDILGPDADKIPKELIIDEPDIDRFIKEYVRHSEALLKKNYRYLTALNLEHHFKILKYAPGMEEYGLLLAYQRYLKRAREDILLFDMPPTALALKFFSLPFVSIIWLKQLRELRRQILEKKQIISRVKLGKKVVETDSINKNLEEQLEQYEKITQQFQNGETCRIAVVANPDSVSIAESARIIRHLEELKISVSEFFLNKGTENGLKQLPLPVKEKIRFIFIQPSTKALVGMNVLSEFMRTCSQSLV
ncbi:ArsA family ATPase [Calditrichota bacterium GD2]